MAQHLDDYSIEKLRIALPSWPQSLILELLGKIRATYKKYSSTMSEEYMLELLRKETVIRKELYYRIKQANYNKFQNHRVQEKLIGGRIEEPFKIR